MINLRCDHLTCQLNFYRGYEGEDFSIFNGYYQWDDSDWWSSEAGTVNPVRLRLHHLCSIREITSMPMFRMWQPMTPMVSIMNFMLTLLRHVHFLQGNGMECAQ